MIMKNTLKSKALYIMNKCISRKERETHLEKDRGHDMRKSVQIHLCSAKYMVLEITMYACYKVGILLPSLF